MKKSTLVLVVAVPFLLALAATGLLAADAPQPEILTNGSIVEMKSLGLGDDVIVQKIKSSKCNFDVSINGFKELKSAQISDAVIQAMLASQTPAAPATVPPPPVPPSDPNDPVSPHDPGIWLYQEANGQRTMTKIEPSVFSQTKAGTPFFAIYGQTSKARAVMNPAHSKLQLNTSQPVFYFYFEKSQSGLSDSTRSATSPEDFALLKMEVRQDHNERRVVIGKVGMSSTSGFDSKEVVETEYSKADTGVFKVGPKAPLANGEYCFLYSGNSAVVGFGYAAGGPGKGFCFAVQTGKTDKK
jgi:hypothetical protein